VCVTRVSNEYLIAMEISYLANKAEIITRQNAKKDVRFSDYFFDRFHIRGLLVTSTFFFALRDALIACASVRCPSGILCFLATAAMKPR
jgi:hypothetical protein